MAVNNSLATAPANANNKAVEYQVNGETVKLSPAIVRNYLTNGSGNVTDQEVAFFINLCKYQKLNPLIKDAYLIKYGSQPATMVVGKDALLKRAKRNPLYKGHEAGIIVRLKDSRELEYRTGSFILPEEELIGGWAKTYVEGYQVPIETAVSFREYAGTKGDGSLNSMWSGKPGTMIRKVALVASLREAFPEDLGGMYEAEEVHVDPSTIDDAPVIVDPPTEEAQPEPIEEYAEPVAAQEPQPAQMAIDDLPAF